MSQELLGVDETAALITQGKTLLIAGDEQLLHQLPKGKWIAGSTPYLIRPDRKSLSVRDRIHVTDISAIAVNATIRVYDREALSTLYTDAGCGGFSFIIIPASSPAHIRFALNAPVYENFASQPLVGWIAGIHLDDLGTIPPCVFDGESGKKYTDEAIVMHTRPVAGKTVDVGIINIFEQGDGDSLTFTTDGFSATELLVNGVPKNFAEYIASNNLDTRLPLVADYYGASINTSFQSITPDGTVNFYAPVFQGVRYKHARPVADYVKLFNKRLKEDRTADRNIIFSCNCLVNYLYQGEMVTQVDSFSGPVTFGEIAYQLLNQTMVYLQLSEE